MSMASDKLRNRIINGERVGGLANAIVVAGYRACTQGKSRRSCPYRKSDKPAWFCYWMLGWDNADNDRNNK